jgi:hypothetical protein
VEQLLKVGLLFFLPSQAQVVVEEILRILVLDFLEAQAGEGPAGLHQAEQAVQVILQPLPLLKEITVELLQLQQPVVEVGAEALEV